MRLRVGLTAALAVSLLTGCGLLPFLPGGHPGPTQIETTTTTPLPPIDSPPTPETIEDRVRAVLARTGGDELVGVTISDYGVEVKAISNNRIYTYGENDRDPHGRNYDGAALPFTLEDVDLPAIMTRTSEVEANCTEPRWELQAVAYDLRYTDFSCASGARYQFWDDGSLIKISTATVRDAQDAFDRLPAAAPEQVYELVLSHNASTGDALDVWYADDEVGSVDARLGSDETNPVTGLGLGPGPFVPFALSDVSAEQVVSCGQQQMADAQMNWWFVNIRYSVIHDQVVMKWDTTGGWTSVGPLTTLDCQTVE